MNLIRTFGFWALCSAVLLADIHGQSHTAQISSVKTQYLKYDRSTYPSAYALPFKEIKVVDYRFDSTKVGYRTYNRSDNHTRLAVEGGVEQFLNTRLNEYFRNNLTSSSPRTLLIVLKKLWLQYASTNVLLDARHLNEKLTTRPLNRNTWCLADMDVFVQSDSGCRALVRLTYNFYFDQPGRYSDMQLLLAPFDSLMNKIQSMNIPASLAAKKNFTLTDVFTSYKKRFDIPVLSASQVATGIFLSFEDFKNNKASYPDFTYKISELSTDLTVMQGGKPVAITDYWGFYDGKDLFMRPGFLPFKVMRQGNTFDMLGSLRSVTRMDYIPIGMTGVQAPIEIVPGYPLQIDMETGKVY